MTKPPTTHERLARIEEALFNHVIHRLNILDRRLWGILASAIGALVAALIAAIR